jgi:hypothetical protein
MDEDRRSSAVSCWNRMMLGSIGYGIIGFYRMCNVQLMDMEIGTVFGLCKIGRRIAYFEAGGTRHIFNSPTGLGIAGYSKPRCTTCVQE